MFSDFAAKGDATMELSTILWLVGLSVVIIGLELGRGFWYPDERDE